MFNTRVWGDFYKALEEMDALVIIGASTLIGTWRPAYETAKEYDLPIISINKARNPWWKMADYPLRGDAAILTPELLG